MGRGGGLLLAVNNLIPVKMINLPAIDRDHEAHVIKICYKKRWIAAINIYAPKSFEAVKWLDNIKSIIGHNYIIVGDFNINFLN